MADRVVSIELVANATGLVRGVHAARDAVGELRDEVQSSAMSQREAWSKVGAGLTAVGVATTGIMVAVLKTGIAYNTLQQTSRAALTTLLGSAQAANAQMDKLDEFARTSPFAKQTFIQAQQQMLAFGIETEKVIPYLDAVQNGVAAMGGSNQQISEIAFIMSQISAASKITGQDLIQFGQRGINAAELIGSQMGKTGGEIRAEITAGTLDANVALDALAAGMEQRFGGAAENVKNTFEGSMDRVKAAWRDFASELAKPLVDPNGGGALVDLLNWTADAMRNFQKLPEPVKNTVSALTGLVGVGSLLAGTMILALPKWIEFRTALSTIGVTGGTVRSGLGGLVRFLGGPWGIAMMTAAASVAVFNAAMDASKVSAADMEISIKQGKSALGEMQETATKNEQGLTRLFVDVGQHVKNFGPLLDKAATSGRGFFSSLTFNEQGALDNIKELGTALSSLAAEDLSRAQREFKRFGDEANLSRQQLATALDEMPVFKSALLDYADSAGIATDDTTLLKIAMGEIGPAADDNVSSLEEIQGAAADTTGAVERLADEIMNFGKANIDSERAALQFEEQLQKLNERVESGETGLKRNTEAGRENRESLLDMAEATSKAAGQAQLAGESQEKVNEILDRGRDALIEAGIAYGMAREDAATYADQILATPKSVTTKANFDASAASNSILTFKQKLDSIPRTVPVEIRVAQSMIYKNPGAIYPKGAPALAFGGTVPGAANGITVGIAGGVSHGTVYGAGTAKSDSVLVALSRGEEVTQEPYASQNRGLLKAINRGELHQSMLQPQIAAVGQQGPVEVSLAGATFELDVEGQQMTAFVRKQVVGVLGPVSSGGLNDRLGVV